ncbi:hypothetical protein TELCIR_24053 [Teladorsagia circumcincta]|uniref:Uncharacterized protein n=1 Tax=Teladorsagia circumcincta TaxID=45464 RepID=A0A2G9TB26_TELCI|nr:hypothetical protein TELCIR_24053 [Teladorsagia circumcincta]
MSNYTENDRAAVLGIGLSKNKRESPEKVKVEEPIEQKEETSTELNSNTTVSTLSVAEYFAAKMAALKTKKEEAQSDVQAAFEMKTEVMVKEEENSEQSTPKERKKKRREMKRLEESFQYSTPSETCEVKVEVVDDEEVPVEDDDEMRRQRRREKKLKRRQERAQQEIEVWFHLHSYVA